MGKFKKFLIFFVLAVLVIVGGTFSFLYMADYSDGHRTGKVIKLSRRGVLFKTYEGQLNVEGISSLNSGQGPSSVWEFSVETNRTDVIQQIEKAMDGNKRVKIYYDEKFYQFFWRGDTKYLVTKVELLD